MTFALRSRSPSRRLMTQFLWGGVGGIMVAMGLACAGWNPTRSVDFATCGVQYEVPMFWLPEADAPPDQDIYRTLDGGLTLVWCEAKQEFDEARSLPMVLDLITDGYPWWRDPSRLEMLLDLDIVTHQPWPQARRMAWTDDRTEVLLQEVIELPDRFVYVRATTETPDHLDTTSIQWKLTKQLDEVVDSMTYDRLVFEEGFPGETDVPVATQPLRELRTPTEVPVTAQGEPAPLPPSGWSRVSYPSNVGELAAYLTVSPDDGTRHPAVLWAHGGFQGIGSWLTPTEETPGTLAPFVEAGLVVMAPSWRGEHDNPGNFELFGGEVDDLLAARDYLADLPWVDPDRIYLVGHGSGGSLVLLATTQSEAFRAAFAFDAVADMGRLFDDFPDGYGNTPYNPSDTTEHAKRSFLPHVAEVGRPTVYLEGELDWSHLDVLRMQRAAQHSLVPVSAHVVPLSENGALFEPALEWITRTIVSDIEPQTEVQPTQAELNALALESWSRLAAQQEEQIIHSVRDHLRAGFDSDEDLVNLILADLEGPYARQKALAWDALRHHMPLLDSETANWPAQTDCDRLDRAFASLEASGFIARQHLQACRDCAINEVFELLDSWGDNFLPPGYVVYSQEDTFYALEHGLLYIGYGGGEPTEEATIAAGERIVTELKKSGLTTSWNGDPGESIEVTIDWKRRRPAL